MKLFPMQTLDEAKRALWFSKLPQNAGIRDTVQSRIYERYPELRPKKRVTIMGFSRRFPPDFHRRWYIVMGANGFYRLRYNGKTEPYLFRYRDGVLDYIELYNYLLQKRHK